MRAAERASLAALVACAAAVVAFALPTAASAYFAPGAQIVSVSPEKREQADDSTSAVDISDDGRYVVFQTRARNLFDDADPDPPGQFRVGGIFRRDLQTGALALVTPGELRDDAAPDAIVTRGSANPSVSADGRYVAFSTGWQLSAADTNGNVDVYVRDMSKPASDPAAFELVSALNGSGIAAGWAASSPDRPGRNAGAEVTAGRAISADGRRVVFATREAGNLPSGGPATVEAGQLFVRDLATQATTLVTRDKNTGAPAGGAIAAATISGGGGAVVWVARRAAAQTALLNGENADADVEYFLYRRLDQGPSAPTRRITGIADIDDPGCSPGATVIDDWEGVRQGPCYGPLGRPEWAGGTARFQAPVLSDDGWTVAFLTDAQSRGAPAVRLANDLFVTSMWPGLSRKSATLELTRETLTPGAGESLEGLAMSGDGRWILLTTARRRFEGGALRQVGGARSDSRANELYLVDTIERTVERVITSRLGADAAGDVGTWPAISADGRRIAFTSLAANLFYGDANGVADAFTVERLDAPPAVDEPPEPGGDIPPVEDPQPAEGAGTLPLPVSVRRAGSGRVRLVVQAPETGELSVTVRGRLPNLEGRLGLKPITLASRTARVRRRGKLTVDVRLANSYRRNLRAAGRITAQARVAIDAASGSTYERRVTVQFRK